MKNIRFSQYNSIIFFFIYADARSILYLLVLIKKNSPKIEVIISNFMVYFKVSL